MDLIVLLVFSYDGQLLVLGGLDGIVNVWDSLMGVLKQKLEGFGEVIEVSDVFYWILMLQFYFFIYNYILIFIYYFLNFIVCFCLFYFL